MSVSDGIVVVRPLRCKDTKKKRDEQIKIDLEAIFKCIVDEQLN